ncbi:unnamed protein product [Mucor fragilis]
MHYRHRLGYWLNVNNVLSNAKNFLGKLLSRGSFIDLGQSTFSSLEQNDHIGNSKLKQLWWQWLQGHCFYCGKDSSRKQHVKVLPFSLKMIFNGSLLHWLYYNHHMISTIPD